MLTIDYRSTTAIETKPFNVPQKEECVEPVATSIRYKRQVLVQFIVFNHVICYIVASDAIGRVHPRLGKRFVDRFRYFLSLRPLS